MRKIFFTVAVAAFLLLSAHETMAQNQAAAPTGGQSSGTAGTPTAGTEDTFFKALNDFYLFGLSLVGISALFVMVWGGVQYVTAGESESRSSRGRQRINSALWGILIAAVSYALLYTINPELVKFKIGVPSSLSEPPGSILGAVYPAKTFNRDLI